MSEFVTIEDPVEKCFTVELPKGWFNRAYTSRAFDVHRQVVTSVSPNEDTVLYLGDPNIPQYWTPEFAHDMIREWARVNPMVKIEPFQEAKTYLPAYVKRKFGSLEGFEITKTEDNQQAAQSYQRALAQNDMQGGATAANVHFRYKDHGKQMSAMVVGLAAYSPGFWIVDVNGLSTTGNAEDYLPLLARISRTMKTNPAWTQRQQQLHEQRMAQIADFGRQMTAQHNRNMQAIQLSAQRHQTRMEAIWAAGEASNRAYYERSAASDAQHSRFLNYINDEHTVVGSSGAVRQVDNSYQRYWINRNNNSYVGGDINFDDRSIRAMGLNPDDYEEARIRR
ncbi:MAG: hypothetical protein KF812_03425 [Fimbriimonadaceae bacterium]|nr:hypothetical protein [Fimbriimonadaceae bacterium]